MEPEERQYIEAVSRLSLIQAAARALDPGCKADSVPISEGFGALNLLSCHFKGRLRLKFKRLLSRGEKSVLDQLMDARKSCIRDVVSSGGQPTELIISRMTQATGGSCRLGRLKLTLRG